MCNVLMQGELWLTRMVRLRVVVGRGLMKWKELNKWVKKYQQNLGTLSIVASDYSAAYSARDFICLLSLFMPAVSRGL